MEISKENFFIEKEEPIIKNICYNPQTNKLTMVDNRNNKFACDIFGRKKRRFIPSISGMATAAERKKTRKKFHLITRNIGNTL